MTRSRLIRKNKVLSKISQVLHNSMMHCLKHGPIIEQQVKLIFF